MRAPIGPFWKRLAKSKSGNAMLLVALGTPALIGAAGYGVDMAQLYMWKRELQHSVDQAAIAGAWALAYDEESTNYVARARQEFDSNQDRTAGFDTAPTVELADYDGGNNNSVVVSASVAKRLPFSGFLIDAALYVRATAQATFAEGAAYKACLMTLKKGEAATFEIGGSATVNAKCGLGALSCEDGAISIYGSPSIDTDSIATCGTVTIPTTGYESLESKISENANLSNPFEGLPPPEPEDNASKSLTCPTGQNKDKTTYLSPGRYVGGMNIQCKVVFSSGIYVIDGGVLDMTDQKAVVTGTKVMFVLKNGAQLRLSGQGTGGSISLSPMEAGDFVGTANEPYKNLYADMLFYEDATGQTSPVSHRIGGNAGVSVSGTIYLPNGDVEVTGSSSTNPLCFQVWSSTLTITGNTTLSTTCSAGETNEAGKTAAGVRLVA